MTKKNKHRPINLNLKNIKFPLTAIASISHRISGIIIFFMIGLLLLILRLSLLSTENFYKIKLIMGNFFIKITIWYIFIFFIYHFINGIRNILMDFGYLNETLSIGKKGAYITFVMTGMLSFVLGFLLYYYF